MKSTRLRRFNNTASGRLARLIIISALLLAGGLLYALFFKIAGFGIPCIFNKLTGFKCPGCGISRMFISLFEGNFVRAWSYNPAVICISPLGVAAAADISVRYVREGRPIPHKWAEILMYIMIAVLLIFGILRNIPF